MANQAAEIQRYRINRHAWKSNLIKEIINLEDNLDQLFHIVGLKSQRIVAIDNTDIDESTIVGDKKSLRDNLSANEKHRVSEYELIIDENYGEIHKSVNRICALITSVTEFDIPIPILVLIRLASRLFLLKCPDYKRKVSGSLSRRYVLNKSIELIKDGLKMYKWISIVLGTNSLPFQPFINQNLFNILDWMRSSNLIQHDSNTYLLLRSQVIRNISAMLECLSVNLNLESSQLRSLIEYEIINDLSSVLFSNQSQIKSDDPKMGVVNGSGSSIGGTGQAQSMKLRDDYAVEALVLAERVFVVYADFLEASTEQKLKSFVIQTCLKIYRDFERNVIGLAVRRQLIRMVETIANRPYATSTTELAWHIFELADRNESDAEIKFIARRSIKIGLAHRPIIVSNYGVYTSHTSKLVEMTAGEGSEIVEKLDAQPSLPAATIIDLNGTESAEGERDKLEEQGEQQEGREEKEKEEEQREQTVEERVELTQQGRQADEQDQVAKEKSKGCRDDDYDDEQVEERPEDDPQVQSYLCLFVDKPAS